MFNFTDSGSSDEGRTHTITIAYADEECLKIASTSSSYEESSATSSSLATPSTLASVRSLLDRLEVERQRELYFGYHPIWREMSMSEGIKMRTLEYLWEAKVFQLFNFMMTHLLAQTPEDPVAFLVDLLDRCIRYRDSDEEPPLVFEEDHVRSVYTALDPLGEGSVSYSQYLVGMQTLGLTEFNILPDPLDQEQRVAKDVFVKEVKAALMKQLDVILGKGRKTVSDVIDHVVDYDAFTLDK